MFVAKFRARADTCGRAGSAARATTFGEGVAVNAAERSSSRATPRIRGLRVRGLDERGRHRLVPRQILLQRARPGRAGSEAPGRIEILAVDEDASGNFVFTGYMSDRRLRGRSFTSAGAADVFSSSIRRPADTSGRSDSEALSSDVPTYIGFGGCRRRRTGRIFPGDGELRWIQPHERRRERRLRGEVRRERGRDLVEAPRRRYRRPRRIGRHRRTGRRHHDRHVLRRGRLRRRCDREHRRRRHLPREVFLGRISRVVQGLRPSTNVGESGNAVGVDGANNVLLTGSIVGPWTSAAEVLRARQLRHLHREVLLGRGTRNWSKRYGALYDDHGWAITADSPVTSSRSATSSSRSTSAAARS